MTEKEKEKQRAAFVHLGFTEEEIEEVMEADKRIDNGEKLFELNAEQKAASKAARITTGDKTQYKPKVREKPVNDEKRLIIETLRQAVEPMASKTEVTNIEREFVFYVNNVKYKVTLACPRS